MLPFGQEVRPGTRDDIAVFWADGEQKRVIVGSDYGETHATLERILRKFQGGRIYYESLRAKVSELSEPGRVIVATLGSHCVGLMRPYLFGDDGDDPYVVCRRPVREPNHPVLCGSWEVAQSFAKQAIRDEGLSRDGWCAFRGSV